MHYELRMRKRRSISSLPLQHEHTKTVRHSGTEYTTSNTMHLAGINQGIKMSGVR